MKNLWVAMLVLGLAAGISLVAQEHSKEKKASDQLRITSPVMFGNQMLQPGTYHVACNGNEVTFSRVWDDTTVLTLPCKGKEMSKRAENTELHTTLNEKGVRVVDKLLIRGSNVEHVF